MGVEDDGWSLTHESPLPRRIATGRGSGLHVSGWLFHADAATVSVSLSCGDGPRVPVTAHSMGRPDVRNALSGTSDRVARRAQASGFWGVLPLLAVEQDTMAPVVLHARAANGATLERVIGHPVLTPTPAPACSDVPADAELVICLATWEPDAELFAAQIASIQAQTYRDWRCIVADDASSEPGRALIAATVGDDPRFTIVHHGQNIGFYGNFERALLHVPPDARYVALADQDDIWFPQKLGRLVAALRDGASLAYCDMHVVERDGTIRHRSFWTTRKNNSTHVAALISANTVTGAASVFDRRLLDVALPFPPRWRNAYHDHWIALTALATGTITFVDEPLQAYIQHGAQVIGHALHQGAPPGGWARVPGTPAWFRRWRYAVETAGSAYAGHTLYRHWLATILLARTGHEASPRVRRSLERAVRGDQGLRGLLFTAARALAGRGPRRSTVGHHGAELRGALWRRRNRWHAGRPDREVARLEPVVAHFQDLVRYLPDERD